MNKMSATPWFLGGTMRPKTAATQNKKNQNSKVRKGNPCFAFPTINKVTMIQLLFLMINISTKESN